MSDRDEVRKLAEEIAEESIFEPGSPRYLGKAARWRDKITTLLAQREATLQAQLHRALGELDLALACQEGLSDQVADLQATVARLEGERDRALGELGQVRERVERDLVEIRLDGKYHCRRCGATGAVCVSLVHRDGCPLSSSPLSERAGTLVRLVVADRESALAGGRSRRQAIRDRIAIDDAVDALRAEFQKGGEREEPRSLRSTSRRYEMSVHPPEGRPPRA